MTAWVEHAIKQLNHTRASCECHMRDPANESLLSLGELKADYPEI